MRQFWVRMQFLAHGWDAIFKIKVWSQYRILHSWKFPSDSFVTIPLFTGYSVSLNVAYWRLRSSDATTTSYMCCTRIKVHKSKWYVYTGLSIFVDINDKSFVLLAKEMFSAEKSIDWKRNPLTQVVGCVRPLLSYPCTRMPWSLRISSQSNRNITGLQKDFSVDFWRCQKKSGVWASELLNQQPSVYILRKFVLVLTKRLTSYS